MTTPWYLKLGLWLVGGLLSLVLGSIPLVLGYFVYHFINPQTEVMRFAAIALLLFVGGGGSLALWGFLFIAMLAWTGAILDG